MNGYRVVLFAHLLALLAAFGASTVVHVAMARVRTARTGGEALEWLRLAHALSRVFPVALATLLATGASLVHGHWPWGAGFVEAGLAGVALLLVSGALLEGGRAHRVAAALEARRAEPISGAAAGLVRDPLWWGASWGNTGTALAVVFAMATKPSPAVAFTALAVGLAAGCAVGLLSCRRGTAAAAEPAPSTP